MKKGRFMLCIYVVGERKVLKKQKKILQVGNNRCKKRFKEFTVFKEFKEFKEFYLHRV